MWLIMSFTFASTCPFWYITPSYSPSVYTQPYYRFSLPACYDNTTPIITINSRLYCSMRHRWYVSYGGGALRTSRKINGVRNGCFLTSGVCEFRLLKAADLVRIEQMGSQIPKFGMIDSSSFSNSRIPTIYHSNDISLMSVEISISSEITFRSRRSKIFFKNIFWALKWFFNYCRFWQYIMISGGNTVTSA